MATETSPPGPRPSLGRAVLTPLGLYAGVLAVLFRDSFKSGLVLFNNDGPLGVTQTYWEAGLGAFLGLWQPLNWVGGQVPSALPSLSAFLYYVLGPVGSAKFWAPLSLLFLGLSAWLLFRQLRFHPLACTLGGLAALLNSNTFSNACWGLPIRALTLALVFLALAALVSGNGWRGWVKAALAGLAVGMSIMEGADGAAIFSVYVAGFVAFQAFVSQGPPARRLITGFSRLVVVTACAVFMATDALSVLIGTQIQGVVGMEQDPMTKAQRWDAATQWSLPKVETARVLIAGLFGYRLDTPNGGNYWGAVGRTPGWEEHHQGWPRHSGSGEYAGVLVVLVAAWAFVQSLRKTQNPFPEWHRKFIWFWAAMAVVSLLLAWGRHAPFYQFVYALPYFSTIRNPLKFMHPFHGALLILFASGLHGLSRVGLERAKPVVGRLKLHLKSWWATAPVPDKKWVVATLAAVGVSVLGWLLYASASTELQQHLRRTGFPDPGMSAAIARFSRGEVAWFVLFLAASVAALTVTLSGWLAGPRAKWAGVLLGALLVVDLGRANLPWIVHYDYRTKYATNPVFDLLRQEPFQGRVTVLPLGLGDTFAVFQQVYAVEWLQHQFQYYQIQSLDVIQDPRPAVDNTLFKARFPLATTNREFNFHGQFRLWQLTNTRYLFGLANEELLQLLNQQLPPGVPGFRLLTGFTLYQDRADGPVKAVLTTNGPLALLEFTGALPRAKLFSRWQGLTNDETTLATLADPAFNPQETVLVAGELPGPTSGGSTSPDAGTVQITRYRHREVELRADVKTEALLLFNDKYHPAWRVTVDGQPAPLLRCNYLMRGVQLTPGQHVVTMRFAPPAWGLYVSLAAILVGVGLCGLLGLSPRAPESASDLAIEERSEPHSARRGLPPR